MRAVGVEPTRYCYHRILNPARLPIPPRPLNVLTTRLLSYQIYLTLTISSFY